MIAQLQEKEKMIVEGLDFQSLDIMESKTDLWLKKKMGRFSGSEFHRLMGYEDKEDFPSGAETYATEKAVETLLSDPEPSYSNDAMDRGSQTETESVLHFMEVTGLKVEKYGEEQEFVELGKHVGCTPDGRIGHDGGIEGKCPNAKTHFFYLLNLRTAEDLKKHCKNYYWQCQGNMYVTDSKYWYFFSYDPRFENPKHKMLILKIERNDEDIEKLKRRLKQAIEFKNKMIRQLNGNGE
tara:strand:+ start:5980 stop:6693 length:714 start_codon:yes stop_codon:yes gene_type:complete